MSLANKEQDNMTAAESAVVISQLKNKLHAADKLLHFTKQHHAITVSDLQRELADLRQRYSNLNFKLHMMPDDSAPMQKTDDESILSKSRDEVALLHLEIQELRSTNGELKTSVRHAKKYVEMMTCCTCGGRPEDRQSARKLRHRTSLQELRSGQDRTAADSSAEKSREGQAPPPPQPPQAAEAVDTGRRKLRSKSKSLPATNTAFTRRQLPDAPTATESRDHGSSPTDGATSSPLSTMLAGAVATEFLPRPPSTPKPDGQRLQRHAVRSMARPRMAAISMELKDVLAMCNATFGCPPLELWELPRDQQLRAASLEYYRAVLLNKEKPAGIMIPPKPEQATEVDYLIHRQVLSTDGKQQLSAQPPTKRRQLPSLAKHRSNSEDSLGKELRKRSRNAYAGPRLADDVALARTARTLQALANSQGVSGAHSAVDLPSAMATMEDEDRSRRRSLGERRRRRSGEAESEPALLSVARHPYSHLDRGGPPRLPNSNAAAALQREQNEVDVNDTELSCHLLPIDTANGENSSSRRSAASTAAGAAAATNQLTGKVLVSPYIGQRSNKLAARPAIREKLANEQRTVYSKDLSKQKPPMEQEAAKK